MSEAVKIANNENKSGALISSPAAKSRLDAAILAGRFIGALGLRGAVL